MSTRLPLFLRGLAVLLLITVPTLTQAATLNVPSANYPTIQSGINAAADGDTVLVADGTYTGDGNRDIDFFGKNITVTSQHGAAKTIIDCQGSVSSQHRGFFIYANEFKVTISGFTVQNGFEYGSGGGIDIENFTGGIINITGCIVTGNTAYTGGGVSNINDSTGTITLTNCTVTENTASFGGGIHNDNDSTGTIMFSGCSVIGNTATYGYNSGGGVYNYNSGTVVLTQCIVSGNSAPSGAGVLNANVGSGTTTLSACEISGNTASFGGGVYLSNSSGTTTLINCTITGNTVTEGGGVTGGGGGVFSSGGGTNALTNCTLTGNTGSFGGGIYDDSGPITLTNDILYGNMGNEAANREIAGFGISATNCDIKISDPGIYPGVGNINADPLFTNTATGDLHLKHSSPCLGAGTPNGAPATDKDGQLRPNPPSIGAYELHPPPAPATITAFSFSTPQIDTPGAKASALVTTSGTFSKVTITVPRGSLGIVSPTFTLTNYGGPYWYGTIPTAFLKLAKTNPVTFIATGTRADGSTATMTTTLQINNRPALSLALYPYPNPTVVHRNENIYLYGYVGDFTGLPALYTTVQIILPPGIDYVSSDGAFTYNAATRTLTQGFPSLTFQQFNIVFHTSATASMQKPLTIPVIATCPGFQQAEQNTTVQVIP